MEKNKFKSNILLITYAILLFIFIQNMSTVYTSFSGFMTLLLPFIYGFVIAYLFNRPFNLVYHTLSHLAFVQKHKKLKGLIKGISLVCVYILVFMLVILFFALIIPQLITSIQSLSVDFKGQYEVLKDFSSTLLNQFEFSSELWTQLESLFTNLLTVSIEFIYTVVPSLLSSIISLTSSITNFVFGLIISLYILSNKEKLCRQAKQLTLAFLPDTFAKTVIRVTALTHRIFSSFINGQLIDAFILGSLCFVGMTILGFPYALLISVIIGASNIIPILGPILGTVPTAFIVLMSDPTHPLKAIWFILFIIILQQIDSNIIYPRVVGGSIGLSGLWVLFAILVIGGQFGLLGMIIGVPICAIIYTLLREATYKRLREKEIPIESET